MLARSLHVLWALLGLAGCVSLVASRGGHPPGIVLLPVALPIWAGGHLFLWGVSRADRSAAARTADARGARRTWPVLLTLLGSGILAFAVFWWMLISWLLVDGREAWRRAWPWTAFFLPWLAHALVFVALLRRWRAARALAAGLWGGWAALLCWQVARELSRYGVRDVGELALALALIGAAAGMAAGVWRTG